MATSILRTFALYALCTLLLLQDLVVAGNVDRKLFRWQESEEAFKTEPKFTPPKVKIFEKVNDTGQLAPGYIFLDPQGDLIKRTPGEILDQDGNLVFWGERLMLKASQRVQNIHVCDYRNKQGNHLCWTDVGFFPGGKNRIFDNSYTQVGKGDYGITGGFKDPNPHEFHTVDHGKTFVQAAYRTLMRDLRPYGSKYANGGIVDGCFQEVDVRTGNELFRWCAMDHYKIWQTDIFLAVKKNLVDKVNRTMKSAGDGSLYMGPWDWMHLNAVDKNEEGDYLVSARHFDQIIKVAGMNAEKIHGVKPGKVMWKLGGPQGTIEMDEEVKFGLQHHARFLSTNSTHTVITVFNNGGDPVTPKGAPSDCRIISINNSTNKAYLVKKFVNEDLPRSVAQGSCSVLPNGNVFVGWGKNPMFSEFTPDGTRIYNAVFGAVKSYRVYKFPWIGRPKWKPKLLAYAQNCRYSPLVAYVSWNGATEVKSWRFLVSTESKKGPWILAGTWKKDGFETQAILGEKEGWLRKLTNFVPYVKVEALDIDKKVIATTTANTWVPMHYDKQDDELICDRYGCSKPERFDYRKEYSRAAKCRSSETPHWIAIGLVVGFIETCNYIWQRFCKILMRYEKRRVRLR